MKKAILTVLIVAAVGCTDPENTRRTLEASGFTEIQVLGYDAWSCSDSDTYHTKFRAKNVNGQIVEGTVCCGAWTKGCTVRF